MKSNHKVSMSDALIDAMVNNFLKNNILITIDLVVLSFVYRKYFPLPLQLH